MKSSPAANRLSVAGSEARFLQRVIELTCDPEQLRPMGNAARERILTASWDAAFEMTYGAYRQCHKNWQTTHPAAPIQSPNARDFEAVA